MRLSRASLTAVCAVVLLSIVTLFATGCRAVRQEKQPEAAAPGKKTLKSPERPPDPFPIERGWAASGSTAAIVAGGEEATEIGLQILLAGGNAFDAGAATLLASTVVEHTKFHFGGEVPIMVYRPQSGTVEVLCGVGRAPQLATLEYFTKRGAIPPPRSEDGANAVVPGAFHAILTMLDRYGTMTFEEVSAGMLALLDACEESWQRDLAATVRTLIDAESQTRRAGGDRSAGIAAVVEAFYGREGTIAKRIVKWSEENGCLIRAEDMAGHETLIEKPVPAGYKDFTVLKCNTWTQGPYLLEVMNILEGYDLLSMGHNTADYTHTMVEALKLGLADRDRYFGDETFVEVPLEEMLSDEYATARRALIDPAKASLEVIPGDPAGMKAVLEAEGREGEEGPLDDTTTCITADQWGNVMVATPSGWGGTLVSGTGIYLGSRLSSFNITKGHPNAVAPGKRPRTTLTPTLVLKDGRPVAAISVAGGDWQDQIALQLFMSVFEFGRTPADAVTLPRFGTAHLTGSFSQPEPALGSLEISEEVPVDVRDELAARGHVLKVYEGPYWTPSMMVFDRESGIINAAGDPAAQRFSAAY